MYEGLIEAYLDLAAKYLANPGSKIFGLVGASVQGRTQLMGMKKAVPSLETCRVYDLNKKTAQKFAKETSDPSQMKIEVAKSAEAALREADIISTATIASTPYVKGEWYKEGVFHAEISFWDTYTEALRVMHLIFVDDWFQVKHHGVDVSWRAVRDGIIQEDGITGNLGEVVSGIKKGRTDQKQRILFNPIGLAIHDLSEAHRVFQNAKEMGIGKKIALFKNPDAWLKKGQGTSQSKSLSGNHWLDQPIRAISSPVDDVDCVSVRIVENEKTLVAEHGHLLDGFIFIHGGDRKAFSPGDQWSLRLFFLQLKGLHRYHLCRRTPVSPATIAFPFVAFDTAFHLIKSGVKRREDIICTLLRAQDEALASNGDLGYLSV